ncbi:MAG: hypothetical protein R2774_07785 [Saprospiraceae bacterium]
MKKYLDLGNRVIASIFILITMSIIFMPQTRFFRDIQDYLVHIMLFLLLSGFIGLIINNRIVLFTSFGCAGIMALFLKNASNENLKDPIRNEEINLSVAHINLSMINSEDVLWSFVKDTSIETIVLYEYTPDWDHILNDVSKKFKKYSFTDTRDDVFGKAIFSSLPILMIDTIKSDMVPNYKFAIKKNDVVFNLYSAYITPALNSISRQASLNELNTLSEKIIQDLQYTIVSGEFNQVYWSFDIMNFRTIANLENSRRNINPSSLKMPYQHIFHSQDLECIHFNDIQESQTSIGCIGKYQLKKSHS